MLTGMFSPSSGTALLNGFDITTQTINARNSLGLCPQHNVLIDDLTVAEHIEFFCRMKGVNDKKVISQETSKYANLLDFNDKINALSRSLSGGQKRKLSVGIALCGKSKIVMLDEATSGLDAGARRSLWNLLIEEKKGRTILLTTHHMDEADVLGDRIAIMNEGELQTVGSSFFLKKRFGSGLKLICVKEKGCNPTEVLNVLKEFASDTQLESNVQDEAVFSISEDNQHNFHKMFKKLEDDSEKLKVSSFGCSLTTLEEVFIKVGSDVNKLNKTNLEFNDFVPSRKVRGLILIFYQIYAIILKKFHHTRRNFYSIGWLTLLSIGLSYIFLNAPIEFDTWNKHDSVNPLEISFDPLNSTVTIFENDNSNPKFAESLSSLFNKKDKLDEIDHNYEDYIFKLFRKNERIVHEKYLMALTLKNNSIVIWYSQSRHYSWLFSLALNTFHRALLKSIAGAEYDISVTNKPWNMVANVDANVANEGKELTKEELLSTGAMITNFMIIFMLFYLLLIYWPSIFIGIHVKERVTRSKLLQHISGVNRFIYWLASFLLDYVILTIVAFLIVGAVAIDQRAYFRTGEQLGTLLVVFSFYGVAMIPFVYAFSFVFEKHASAETMIPISGLICKKRNNFFVTFIRILSFQLELSTLFTRFSNTCFFFKDQT